MRHPYPSPQTQTSRPFGRLVAYVRSFRLRRGRRRSSGVSRSFRRSSRVSRSFHRSRVSGWRRFFHGSRRFFRRRRRLAAGRDAEGESRSGRSRKAQFELRHRYYPSSQRQGLPPTQEIQCQGLTAMASAPRLQGHANMHSAESLPQPSAATASASSSCAKVGCNGVGTDPRPISTETCAALPCKCATSTSRMIL